MVTELLSAVLRFSTVSLPGPQPTRRCSPGPLTASPSAALGDLNLATGTLNTGTAARYDISSLLRCKRSWRPALCLRFFIFGNGNGGVADPIGGSGGTTPPQHAQLPRRH